MIQRVLIIGTGLIGSSIGIALRENNLVKDVFGFDTSSAEMFVATGKHAIYNSVESRKGALEIARTANLIILAVPVLAILDWMQTLAPVLSPHQLVTDVGSTKLNITESARELFGKQTTAGFLPGHPMAGKESSGAKVADGSLFRDATWLFTPDGRNASTAPVEAQWRDWVTKFGAHTLDLDAARHDEICAWVSHLPQLLSTSLAALLEETFGSDAKGREEIAAIGGRALREMTRLGASPYSMWRDIALSNTEPIAATLHALEQRLAHIRENLRTPELKEEFRLANEFRSRR